MGLIFVIGFIATWILFESRPSAAKETLKKHTGGWRENNRKRSAKIAKYLNLPNP